MPHFGFKFYHNWATTFWPRLSRRESRGNSPAKRRRGFCSIDVAFSADIAGLDSSFLWYRGSAGLADVFLCFRPLELVYLFVMNDWCPAGSLSQGMHVPRLYGAASFAHINSARFPRMSHRSWPRKIHLPGSQTTEGATIPDPAKLPPIGFRARSRTLQQRRPHGVLFPETRLTTMIPSVGYSVAIEVSLQTRLYACYPKAMEVVLSLLAHNPSDIAPLRRSIRRRTMRWLSVLGGRRPSTVCTHPQRLLALITLRYRQGLREPVRNSLHARLLVADG
jgi:hypothetical protein